MWTASILATFMKKVTVHLVNLHACSKDSSYHIFAKFVSQDYPFVSNKKEASAVDALQTGLAKYV